jgi:hypothetical protein
MIRHALLLVAVSGVASADATTTPLGDLNKVLSGSWACTGTYFAKTGAKVEMKATLKAQLEMDNTWLHDTFDAKLGKSSFHFEAYTTYDSVGRHFHRIVADNSGSMSDGEGHVTGTQLQFDLDTHSSQGDGKFRDHLDWTDAKALKANGETSSDNGKTWTKAYEMTCKKT